MATHNGTHAIDPAKAAWLKALYFLERWGAAETEKQRTARHAAYRKQAIRALGWEPEAGTAAERYCATTGEMVNYLAGH